MYTCCNDHILRHRVYNEHSLTSIKCYLMISLVQTHLNSSFLSSNSSRMLLLGMKYQNMIPLAHLHPFSTCY